ncbi:MAG: bi-domain-containing oxidoreductase [Candidatus Omnitrophota bacterium]
MKQVIQSYKTGQISLLDIPVPACKAGGVLVRNKNSLISIGTEKSMIDIAKKNLFDKAKARPDLVKRFIDKARKEGLLNVYKEAMNRLDEPVALGYSASGVVIQVGSGVSEFKIGDRVACVGAGFASHAEIIWVPENLCVSLPAQVSFEEASFIMLGGIALQGIRQAGITFGENVAVIGLGLLGQLTVQMLRAYSCEIIGIDIDDSKVNLARESGAQLGLNPASDDTAAAIENFTRGHGVDAVIITASSKDNKPIEMAETIARSNARIVLVGVAEINLTRKTFWEKELSFTVSKAAGPGSINPVYEQLGYDYPLQYVRWTEKRNHEHFVSLLSKKSVDVLKLITHRFNIKDALSAYAMILEGKERCIGVVLEYEGADLLASENLVQRVVIKSGIREYASNARTVSCIGGGMFTKNVLLPALSKIPGVKFRGVSTTTGITSHHLGKKYGFEYCTSDYNDVLNDKDTNSIIITTRHNAHAKMCIEALKAGKHVFIEKPLCISREELEQIVDAHKACNGVVKLMVGFNRRFSPLIEEVMPALINRTSPLVMLYRVNAGYIPAEHWTQDKSVGGGRIVGEVCHFIDLLQYISGAYPISVYATALSGQKGKYIADDNVSIQINLSDGSLGTIVYTAAGTKSYSRERIEVFGSDSVVVIDDFKSATIVKNGKEKTIKKFAQEMGYQNELDYFLKSSVQDVNALFPGYVYTTLATFNVLESIEKNAPVAVQTVK